MTLDEAAEMMTPMAAVLAAAVQADPPEVVRNDRVASWTFRVGDLAMTILIVNEGDDE